MWLYKVHVAFKETVTQGAQAEHGATEQKRVRERCTFYVFNHIGKTGGYEALSYRFDEQGVLLSCTAMKGRCSTVTWTWGRAYHHIKIIEWIGECISLDKGKGIVWLWV